ncbi:hypothetical protein [Clostridium sp. MD294]|uniref:hypothetical protein n=1 Tax=Clostridium sp. MD294 TaxID=97138 RepID=UPI0002C9C942|nr:hypothetical protein [Clostridium sp. MD294]NDO45558.1 hypothetical protein [Clostridium sp. MD294]USF30788.1 hypothetical protein C820_002231 [Clostridium sp. MD294]
MFKKITIITAMAFLVSFLGFAITLPIGIKTVFGDVEHLLETSSITPEKIEIPNHIQTLDIDFNNNYYYYNHILVKQSPDDTAYIETFNVETYSSMYDTVSINYIDESTAKIGIEPVYGKFKFNKNTLNKTIVKKLQNYPDAILYIPTRMNIITDNPYYFDNIYFNNKEELLQQADTEEEQQRILEQAERLMEQKREEEEYILQRAEEIRQLQEEERQIQMQEEERQRIDYEEEQQHLRDNY